jgi:hypothetical protein
MDNLVGVVFDRRKTIVGMLTKEDVPDRSFCPFKASLDANIIFYFPCLEKKCRLWNPNKNDCGYVNW